MNKCLLLSLLFATVTGFSALADEFDDVIYSIEGYCLLANEGVSASYLSAYAKKLGRKPSDKVCQSFKDIVLEHRPNGWDYPEGSPYPGSELRFAPSQVALLKALKTQSE